MDWKLELVAVPVSDVDRAKDFYTQKVGLHADHDQQVHETLRFVQLTPPGSTCSICIGTGLTKMKPGSLEGLQMVVRDIEQAHHQLVGRGVEVSAIEDLPWARILVIAGVPPGCLTRVWPGNGVREPHLMKKGSEPSAAASSIPTACHSSRPPVGVTLEPARTVSPNRRPTSSISSVRTAHP